MSDYQNSYYRLSKIFKNAMLEKFEELWDRAVIETHEKKLKGRKVSFGNADKLIKKIQKRASAPERIGSIGLLRSHGRRSERRANDIT